MAELHTEAIPTPASGSSITGLVKMEEGPHPTREDLVDLFESLRVQKKALKDKQKQILDALRMSTEDNAIHALSREKPIAVHPTKDDITTDNKISCKDKVTNPTEEDVIITFVDELEKVNQYFVLRDCLWEMKKLEFDSDSVEVFRYLVQDLKIQKDLKFNKLDCQYIMDAVVECIVELKMKKLFGEDSIRGNTRYKELSKEGCSWYSLMTPPKAETDTHGPLLNPMVSLVYHIREKGHVMNKDPLVELKYIEKYDPVFYECCFIRRLLLKYSEREVIVHYFPIAFNEDKVKELLKICGDVEYVRFESLGQGGEIAYATFKDSEAAKIAPVLMRWTTSTAGYPVSPALQHYEYQPKDRTEYDYAMIKYNEFRKYSKKSSIMNISQKIEHSATRG